MQGLDQGITGTLVVLRPFQEDFISDAYLSWLHDEEVLRYSNQRFRTHTHETSKKYLESFKNTSNLFLGIFSKESSKMIGTITAYIHEHHSTADIGILIGERAVWGHGYGTDAWNALMNYLFVKRNIRKVTGGTLSGNKGMISIMKRAGMQLEGSRKDHEIAAGALQDVLYFARFKGE